MSVVAAVVVAAAVVVVAAVAVVAAAAAVWRCGVEQGGRGREHHQGEEERSIRGSR